MEYVAVGWLIFDITGTGIGMTDEQMGRLSCQYVMATRRWWLEKR